jgi:hypothetical protein
LAVGEIAAAALAPLLQQQDFTSAHVRYLQMKAEAEGNHRPSDLAVIGDGDNEQN